MNLNTVSDKIVFSILKDIKVGHLELTNYDGKNYSFGNIEDTLKANIKIKNKNFTFPLATPVSTKFFKFLFWASINANLNDENLIFFPWL